LNLSFKETKTNFLFLAKDCEFKGVPYFKFNARLEIIKTSSMFYLMNHWLLSPYMAMAFMAFYQKIINNPIYN